MVQSTWIAADWGTTNARFWAMSADGKVVDHCSSDKGMSQLTPDAFEPALIDAVADWLVPNEATTVVACGMVGAAQGWAEAPYLTTPCEPLSTAKIIKAPTSDSRLSVHIIPGVKQNSPADVMRGEETQIAGLIAKNPEFDGVICLPGTHTKWVHISAGEIVSFSTYMTGELFSLLSKQSVLRHTIADSGWDTAAFEEAMSTTISRPESLANKLFSLRSEFLVNDQSLETARARLSGMLIGLELAGSRPYWLGQEVAIVGEGALAALYAEALLEQGLNADIHEVERLTLAGLTRVYHSLAS